MHSASRSREESIILQLAFRNSRFAASALGCILFSVPVCVSASAAAALSRRRQRMQRSQQEYSSQLHALNQTATHSLAYNTRNTEDEKGETFFGKALYRRTW